MDGIYAYFQRLLRCSGRPIRRTTAQRCLLRVEGLEERCVPAAVHTFVVTTTAYTTDLSHLRFDSQGHAFNNNASPVSLFEALAAIDAVNAQTGHLVYPGSSEIDFNVAGNGVHGFAMPAGIAEPRQLIAQDSVTINGFSQPGSSANTSNGANDNARIDVQLNFRLGISASNAVIRGVSVRGIDLGNGHGNKVLGDFIGLTPAGASMSADLAGVTIGAASTSTLHANNDWIGTPAAGDRNVIAGHVGAAGNGVSIGAGSVQNSVVNNLIGTGPTGTNALGNAGAGIYFDATATANNLISGNTIAFNHGAGIQMAGGTQDAFTGNAIFANGIGITLAAAANKGIAAPVFTSWNPASVTGHLASFTPGATYRLDVYNNLQTDAAGHYEGQVPWGSFNVIPDSHGNFTINVVQPASGGLTATITDPQHDTSAFSAPTDFNLTSYSAPTLHLVEGNAATNFLAGIVTHDGNPNANVRNMQATVSWGDGTHSVLTSQASSAGQITVGPYNTYQIRGNHTYAEEGSYHITATVVDTQTRAQNSAINTLVQVADAPLSITTSAISAVEQAAFQGMVATFTDMNPGAKTSEFTATIGWGDGMTTTGTVAATTSGFGVAGSHTYRVQGTYTVTVTVTDQGGATIAGTRTATVADAPLTPVAATVTPVEGAASTGWIGSFRDPGAGNSANYTAVITWGDGHTTTASTAAGTIVPGATAQGMSPGGPAPLPIFFIVGTNTYATAGTYPVTIAVTDQGGATTTINSTANVADAPLSALATAVNATMGSSFSGTLGTFTDAAGPAPITNYTATIDWGDNTPPSIGVIAVQGSTFTITGTHTYATMGTMPITVQIADAGGASTTLTLQASVGGLGG